MKNSDLDKWVDRESSRVEEVMEPRCQRLDKIVQDALNEAHVMGMIASRTSAEYICRCPYKHDALIEAWKTGFTLMES